MVSLYDGVGLWRRVGEERFDRVVADVPCSADGTLRKHRETINDFKKKFWFAATTLHCTQIALLKSGLRMLKVGGRMVYSTCSLNPVENEAVVAEVLRHFNKSGTPTRIRLVDFGEAFKTAGGATDRKIGYMPGLTDWVIPEEFLSTEADKIGGNDRKKRAILRTIYPPGSTRYDNVRDIRKPKEDEVQMLRENLPKAARIMAHLEENPVFGGFFVCVFEKVASFDK